MHKSTWSQTRLGLAMCCSTKPEGRERKGGAAGKRHISARPPKEDGGLRARRWSQSAENLILCNENVGQRSVGVCRWAEGSGDGGLLAWGGSGCFALGVSPLRCKDKREGRN